MSVTRTFAAVATFAFLLLPQPARADVTQDWLNCDAEVLPAMHRSGISNPADAPTQYCLGLGYGTGRIGQKDLPTAVKWLQASAAQNYPAALTILGYHYEKGYGVAADPARAIDLYKRAAGQNYADGTFNLGRATEHGVGTSPDKDAAMKIYETAAGQGSEDARKVLADAGRASLSRPGAADYEKGRQLWLAKDYAGAFPAFMSAAVAGSPDAQLQVGYQYEFGQGVSADVAEAARWYAQAAQQGNAVAQKNLGQLYEDGRGVQENWLEAAKLYQASANQHYTQGEFALGRAYQFGIGVPQDRQQAIAWFARASAQGHAQSEFFKTHLQQGNFIGFRDDAEHDRVIGSKLRFALIFQEPAGRVFRNSQDRDAYLNGLRHEVDVTEAHTMWSMQKNEYDACQRGGGGSCVQPGPEPH